MIAHRLQYKQLAAQYIPARNPVARKNRFQFKKRRLIHLRGSTFFMTGVAPATPKESLHRILSGESLH